MSHILECLFLWNMFNKYTIILPMQNILVIVFERGQGNLYTGFQGRFISMLGIHWEQTDFYDYHLTAYANILMCIRSNWCPLCELPPLHGQWWGVVTDRIYYCGWLLILKMKGNVRWEISWTNLPQADLATQKSFFFFGWNHSYWGSV